jgi:hypothetical protein
VLLGYLGLLSQIASRLLRAVGSGILLALSMHAWRELGAPGAGTPPAAATWPPGIFLQTASRLLRAAAVGIRLAPSMHDWRALGAAGTAAAAVVDGAGAGAAVDVAGAGVLVGALVAAAGVLLAAAALDEAALEGLELDPPQAASPAAISTIAMIVDVRVMCMESSLFSECPGSWPSGFSLLRPSAVRILGLAALHIEANP